VDRVVIGLAGGMTLTSLLLFRFHNPNWLWITTFVVANFLQSAFTGFCPLPKLAKPFGVKLGKAYV
jgi:DUF2892 family protein